MNSRQEWEAHESASLSQFAAKSAESRGREHFEEPCEIRTEYQRDRDRIIHSKSFRRLMHKTQVFISPGDHYRTRLTHTLEVSQIARTIARSLRLNEDLTEAIALGHDLGHTPFGHTGEKVIDEILQGYGLRFRHSQQSLRVVDRLEREGRGLNLTYEVRNGIISHGGSSPFPETMEGQVVRISDRVAYLNHDIDDALRGEILRPEDLPEDCIRVLGESHSKRINTMVNSIISSSKGRPQIAIEPQIKEAMDKLRSYMFQEVYIESKAKVEELKVERLLKELFEYYMEHEEDLPEDYRKSSEDKLIRVTDYISGMTDNYSIVVFKNLFLPKGYKVQIHEDRIDRNKQQV